MSLTIYTASSIKNIHAVRMLHSYLRKSMTLTILDWTETSTPPKGLEPPAIRKWFDTEQVGGQIFAFCRDACRNADLVIYLGCAGQDSGVEIGIAHASGVPVLGIRGALEAPGLMLNGCVDMWVTDVREVEGILKKISICKEKNTLKCDKNCKCTPVCCLINPYWRESYKKFLQQNK